MKHTVRLSFQQAGLRGLWVSAICAAVAGLAWTPAAAQTGGTTARAGIMGKVILDENCNGVQDPGETFMPGITVQLVDSTGKVVGSMVTSYSTGQFEFRGLVPGNYTLQVTAPNLFHVSGTVTNGISNTSSGTTIAIAATNTARSYNENRFLLCYEGNNNLSNMSTFSQSNFGNPSKNGAANKLITANFATLFPNGVTIGGTQTLTFTSASALSAFLPAHGQAGVLTSSGTNVTTSSGGRLAGEVLALQLNVALSNAGLTQSGFSSLKVAYGPFAGMTVADVLALANQVLGGNTSALPSGTTVFDLEQALASINGDFVNGTDRGFLAQP